MPLFHRRTLSFREGKKVIYPQLMGSNIWPIPIKYETSKHLRRVFENIREYRKLDLHSVNQTMVSQLMVNCWFGPRWFGFRLDPLMKVIVTWGALRIQNHQPPNHQPKSLADMVNQRKTTSLQELWLHIESWLFVNMDLSVKKSKWTIDGLQRKKWKHLGNVPSNKQHPRLKQ